MHVLRSNCIFGKKGAGGTGRRAASLACNCTEGQGYQRRAARVEKANGNIDLAFHEHQPQVAKLLKQAVPMLIDYQIAKISVDTGAGIKGVMSVTSKGSLKVEKAASKKIAYEA